MKRGSSNPNVLPGDGAPWGASSQPAGTLLQPGCPCPAPAVKRDPDCWRCQARVRALPAKGSIANLGALPQPEGLGVVVCTHTGSGKGLLQLRLLGKRVAVSAFLLV